MCHGTITCAMAALYPSGRPDWRPGGLVRAAQRPTMLLRAIRPRACAAGGVGCGRGVAQAGARNVSKHIYHAVRTHAAKAAAPAPPQGDITWHGGCLGLRGACFRRWGAGARFYKGAVRSPRITNYARGAKRREIRGIFHARLLLHNTGHGHTQPSQKAACR